MKKSTLAALIQLTSMQPILRGDGATQIKMSYDKADDIPAGYGELYTEKDGKYVLTGVDGMPSQTSIDNLTEALRKERNDHKAVKSTLSTLQAFGTAEELVEKLESYDELKAKAAGAKDPDQLDKLVAAKTAPLQRKLDESTRTIEELTKQNADYKQREVRGTIRSEIEKAAKELKIQPSAISDAVLNGERVLELDEDGKVVTRDNVGVTPFASAKEWLQEILPSKPHWQLPTMGGGAGGGQGTGAGENPYSPQNWNVTKQMELYRKSPEEAKRMAARYKVDVLNPVKPTASK